MRYPWCPAMPPPAYGDQTRPRRWHGLLAWLSPIVAFTSAPGPWLCSGTCAAPRWADLTEGDERHGRAHPQVLLIGIIRIGRLSSGQRFKLLAAELARRRPIGTLATRLPDEPCVTLATMQVSVPPWTHDDLRAVVRAREASLGALAAEHALVSCRCSRPPTRSGRRTPPSASCCASRATANCCGCAAACRR